jgi:hypothetical protein
LAGVPIILSLMGHAAGWRAYRRKLAMTKPSGTNSKGYEPVSGEEV